MKKFFASLKLTFYGLVVSITIMEMIMFGRGVSTERVLDYLPDYNYLEEILELRAEGRLTEASELADFVLANCDVKSREEIVVLKHEIDEQRTSFWNRTKRAVRGFVVGEGKSVEELGGSVVSDMVLYGDVRDLAKQGYFKWTGREVDPVIVALAGIGIATEAVDSVDWAPAVFKTLRKVGALSGKFADFLITECKLAKKTGKIGPRLKNACGDLKKLNDACGISRTAAVMKYVDNADDLKVLAKVAPDAPEAVAIVCRGEGKKGVKLVHKLSHTTKCAARLTKIARKGVKNCERFRLIFFLICGIICCIGSKKLCECAMVLLKQKETNHGYQEARQETRTR